MCAGNKACLRRLSWLTRSTITYAMLKKNQFLSNKAPTFDVVAACLWRARTRTLLSPSSTVRLLFPINTHMRYKPSLPKGYGSTVVYPCAITHAAKLIEKPLPYAASLISAVKKGVSGDEYQASVPSRLMGADGFCSEGAFAVSDMTRLGFTNVDFGWGKAAYGGPARARASLVPGMVTSLITHKNEDRVEGVLALASLPAESLDKFHNEIRKEVEVDFVVPSKRIPAL
ncbi:hypothetical protein TIFTF001_002102 [Ficus carica]|uniref:Uncharacterized protein n=1 Tax=Ficus carica TaxID=3494 RepID=A0AA88CNM4_FICCA|nr:hypothetical protein TIFTF001_002102 [Ficus carica]